MNKKLERILMIIVIVIGLLLVMSKQKSLPPIWILMGSTIFIGMGCGLVFALLTSTFIKSRLLKWLFSIIVAIFVGMAFANQDSVSSYPINDANLICITGTIIGTTLLYFIGNLILDKY